MSLRLNTSAFPEGGVIPKLHTCEGADFSPALEWTGEPAGTRSFTLIADDPDAPVGTRNRWLVYDLSPSIHVLAGVSGTNGGWSP